MNEIQKICSVPMIYNEKCLLNSRIGAGFAAHLLLHITGTRQFFWISFILYLERSQVWVLFTLWNLVCRAKKSPGTAVHGKLMNSGESWRNFLKKVLLWFFILPLRFWVLPSWKTPFFAIFVFLSNFSPRYLGI